MNVCGLLTVIMALPTLGQLLYPLSHETKNLVRRYERCSFKLVRKECSLVFNQLCLREGLLPKYKIEKILFVNVFYAQPTHFGIPK